MDVIAVDPVHTTTDDVRTLIEELDRTLAREYRAEQRHGLPLDELFQPHIRFFTARLDGVAVGCCGVALFADFAELKRMYVRDELRGRGIARALLSRIERETRNAGLDVLRLETGVRQHAALRLYERAGFRRCTAFGHYAALLPHEIATSVFLEKDLSAATH
ncbi:MAG: GNAT family N-acetyltransferase [Vulcanimicrobiaceae bacterium]